MPSSPMPGGASSPIHGTARRRSRFTYRHLSQLASYQTTNPLRVIAHIDLDAFYAQCEMVRLGVPEDKPLAVQQWYATSFPTL
jgi:DNA polymerase eta